MAYSPHILCIVNPISGGLASAPLHRIVESLVSKIPNAEMVKTEYSGHARSLAAAAIGKGYDIVVAVGGDGTVNEVASALVGSDTALGIVPLGSGNGLARHLGIPSQPRAAVKAVLAGQPIRIDAAAINGRPFFCTAGIGFDAQVATDYANAGTRGLITYAKEAVHDWRLYKPKEYEIETEEGSVKTQALLITVGNANQWGNNFFITPDASLQDGKLDIAIVKPASIESNAQMVWQLRHKSLAKNPDVMFLRSSFVRIKCLSEAPVAAHYDGEVTSFDGEIFCDCRPGALKVLAGSDCSCL